MKILTTIFLVAFSVSALAYNDDIAAIVQQMKSSQYQMTLKNVPVTLSYETHVQCPNYDDSGKCVASGVSYIATSAFVSKMVHFPVGEFNIYCELSSDLAGDFRKTLPSIADLTRVQFRYDYSCQQANCNADDKEFSKNVYFLKQYQTLNIDPTKVETVSRFDYEGVVLQGLLPEGNLLLSCGSGYDDDYGVNIDISKRPRLTIDRINSVLKDILVLQKK